MKTGSILVLAGAGLAAWLLLSKKGQGEGGTGGSLDIPAMFGTGQNGGDPVSSTPAITQPVAFQISDKILAAMRGDVQPATQSFGGSSPQAASELSLIQKKGFSTEGLTGSYDPSTRSVYTFALQTATVEKKTIESKGFSTEGLTGSYDPSSGKITTFAGNGNVTYASAATSAKKAVFSAPAQFPNTMGGSSNNSGGTWTGNTFHRGSYK